MACVAVTVAEAVITTIVTKRLEKKENKKDISKRSESQRLFLKKLKWLNNMLWGGSALLVFEHIWHGEIVPWFPFLTGANNPSDTAEMLHEMATTGVLMSVLITAVWYAMVVVSSNIEKKEQFHVRLERS